MLSKTLGAVDGHNVGTHPLVIKLLRGCYNRNPPRPKYSSTWDPSVVVSYIASLGGNETSPFRF